MKALCLLLAGCGTTSAVATGEVGAWQEGPALPVARANHCAVAIDDWVLVIGGNHAAGTGFATTDEIDAAHIAADGTLGPWQVAGHLASGMTEAACTSDGRALYVIGGIYDDPSHGGHVWTASLDDGGMLSPLVSLGALPDRVAAIDSGARVVGDHLVVTHSRVPDGMPDGNLTATARTSLTGEMAWTSDGWSVDFRAKYGHAFSGDFAYVLGGYHDPSVGAVADAFVARLAADGTASPAVPTTPLPAPIAYGGSVAVDDWMFVVGGRAQVFGGSGSDVVYAAPIASDGQLGAWAPAAPLPVARTNHAVVVVGDFLVVTGGAASGPGDDTVLVARVRYE